MASISKMYVTTAVMQLVDQCDKLTNSAIFVYDKYGDVVYSSHMKDYGDSIPLPKGGYIVFLGEDGGTASGEGVWVKLLLL